MWIFAWSDTSWTNTHNLHVVYCLILMLKCLWWWLLADAARRMLTASHFFFRDHCAQWTTSDVATTGNDVIRSAKFMTKSKYVILTPSNEKRLKDIITEVLHIEEQKHSSEWGCLEFPLDYSIIGNLFSASQGPVSTRKRDFTEQL